MHTARSSRGFTPCSPRLLTSRGGCTESWRTDSAKSAIRHLPRTTDPRHTHNASGQATPRVGARLCFLAVPNCKRRELNDVRPQCAELKELSISPFAPRNEDRAQWVRMVCGQGQCRLEESRTLASGCVAQVCKGNREPAHVGTTSRSDDTPFTMASPHTTAPESRRATKARSIVD